MASDVKSDSGTVTAAGLVQSSIVPAKGNLEVSYANGQASLYVGAGLTGTVQLQAVPNGGSATNAEPLTPIGATTANITTPGVYQFNPNMGDYQYFVNCTAFSSGSANVVLSLGPRQ
jgi:hypothetical protein